MNIDWAFQQPVIFYKYIRSDGWGMPIYEDEPVELKVWWSAKQRLIRAANGEERMSEADVKTPLTIDPQENDLFIYLGKQYRVMSAGTPPTIYGEIGHRKVYVESVAT